MSGALGASSDAPVPVQIAHLPLEFQRAVFSMVTERAQVQNELLQLRHDNAAHERTIRALHDKCAALQSQLNNSMLNSNNTNNNSNAASKDTAVAVLHSFTARSAEEVSVDVGDLVFVDATQPFRDWTSVQSRQLGRSGFVPTAVLQQSGEMSRCVAKATVKVAFNGREAQTPDRPPLLTAAVNDPIHVFAPTTPNPVWLEAISVTRHKYGYIPAACVALDEVSLQKLAAAGASAANAAAANAAANTAASSAASAVTMTTTNATTNASANASANVVAKSAATTAATTSTVNTAHNVAYTTAKPSSTSSISSSNSATASNRPVVAAVSTANGATTSLPTNPPVSIPTASVPSTSITMAAPTLLGGRPTSINNAPRTRAVTPPNAPPPLRLVEHSSTTVPATDRAPVVTPSAAVPASVAAVPAPVVSTTTVPATVVAATALPTMILTAGSATPAATPASGPQVSATPAQPPSTAPVTMSVPATAPATATLPASGPLVSATPANSSSTALVAASVLAATIAATPVVTNMSASTSEDLRPARSSSNGLAATKRSNGAISTATAATSSTAAAAEPPTSLPPQSPNRASPASKRARVEPTAREPSVGGAEARGNTSSAVSEEKPEGATTANDQIYRARKQALAARAAMRRADWAVRTRNELDEALKPTHAVDFEDLTRNPL